MDDGCLVEEGNHTELIALKGIYYDTYKRQEFQAEQKVTE